MSTKYIERRHDAAKVATGSHAGIGVEYSTNKIYVKPAPGVDRVELVDTTSTQTLTNKTVDGLEVTNPHFIGDLVLEGTTEDAFETTLRSEATADVVVTLPDATDTLVGKATTDTLTNKTLTSPVINTPTIASPTITGNIVLEGTTSDDYETTIVSEATSSDKTITLPDATDTLVGKATTDTLTNKTLTAPVLTGPTGTGFTRTAIANFVEDATSTSHTATIPIPAGSIIQGIDFQNRAAWVTSANLITTGGWTVGAGWTESPDETFTHAFLGGTAALSHSATIVAGRYYSFAMDQVSGTTGALVIAFGGLTLNVDGNAGATTFTLSGIALNTTGLTITPATGYDGVLADAELIFGATLDIGDTADPDGYIANLLQNDDSVGLLSVVAEGNGAYTNGDGLIIGPTSSNFGFNYVAGSNIIATITNPVPSATAGRTTVVVYYTVPVTFAPTLA